MGKYMRVMVVIENRFLRSPTGVFYSTTNCDYAFWSRYLKVFDEVVVFARVLDIPESSAISDEVRDYCLSNPTDTVMHAFEKFHK